MSDVRRAIAVYCEMWKRQWRDPNAGARLTRFQRAQRGHRIGKAAALLILGPPYRRWWIWFP